MRSPLHPPRFRALVFLIPFALLPLSAVLAAEERFQFAEEPLGQWDLSRKAPSLKINHPSVTLQVEEVSAGPSGEPAHVLVLRGDRRGFRNVKDFAQPITEGVIRFDLRVKNGGLMVTAFASSKSREAIGRGARILFHSTGAVESYFGLIGQQKAKRHTTYKKDVWYRTELTIRVNEQGGGGTYDVRIVDLSTGEELLLTNATELPIDTQVASIGGWSFNLTRANSQVELDNLTFSPTTTAP